ncbi:AhpA/YtjB family protein [Thalassotalea euphylliae]|nr:AhpA/YtjB family protein [Thalassotalea euphylliae]
MQTELPLYPKISSIYNKILQLAIAIVLIVVLLNMLIVRFDDQAKRITAQQQVFADDYIEQAGQAMLVLIKQDKKSAINEYLTKLATPEFVLGATLYDQTGQTIGFGGSKQSINELYGLSSELPPLTPTVSPLVVELRDEKLYGYLRLTIRKQTWQQNLLQANEENQVFTRYMLLIAGLVGFLLARGLSRFSRSSRVSSVNQANHKSYRLKPNN